MQESVLALLQKYMPNPLRPSGGGNVVTRCPFHKGGEERKPSFSVNLEKGVFHCFTGDCPAGAGSMRKLLKLLQVPDSAIDAELQHIQPALDRSAQLSKMNRENRFVNKDPFRAEFILPERIMGSYRFCPTVLVDDGFDPALLFEMEVGYDHTNLRITYPLRDMYGNLAGIVGGVTPWTPQQSPKYQVYQGRRKDLMGTKWLPSHFGKWFDSNSKYIGYKCENHDFLWNFDEVCARIQALPGQEHVIYVVEGFKACLWMIQAGFKNTVALMGSYVSEKQQLMLHRLGCHIVLFMDNDEAGRVGTKRVGQALYKPMYGKISVVPYPQGDENTQPDDYDLESVRYLVASSRKYVYQATSREKALSATTSYGSQKRG